MSEYVPGPNQANVREAAPDAAPKGLDGMTKAELLDVAAERGVEVDPTATKADIRAALE